MTGKLVPNFMKMLTPRISIHYSILIQCTATISDVNTLITYSRRRCCPRHHCLINRFGGHDPVRIKYHDRSDYVIVMPKGFTLEINSAKPSGANRSASRGRNHKLGERGRQVK